MIELFRNLRREKFYLRAALSSTTRWTGAAGACFLTNVVRQRLNEIAPNLSGAGLLAALANESVRRVAAQFGANSPEAKSTRNRRDAFRLTLLLSDTIFDPE